MFMSPYHPPNCEKCNKIRTSVDHVWFVLTRSSTKRFRSAVRFARMYRYCSSRDRTIEKELRSSGDTVHCAFCARHGDGRSSTLNDWQ